MMDFSCDVPDLGTLGIIKIENTETIDKAEIERIIQDYLTLEEISHTTIYITGTHNELLLRVQEQIRSLIKTSSHYDTKQNHIGLFKVRSPRSSISMNFPPGLLQLNNLAVFYEATYHWIVGFKGALAATYDLYSRSIPTKIWSREKYIFELNRKLPAAIAAGFLRGENCSYLLLATSAVLIDYATLQMMGLQIQKNPFFKQWKKGNKAYEELSKIIIPKDFRSTPVWFFKMITFKFFQIVSQALEKMDAMITMISLSSLNLYRIPSFIQKRMRNK